MNKAELLTRLGAIDQSLVKVAEDVQSGTDLGSDVDAAMTSIEGHVGALALLVGSASTLPTTTAPPAAG